MTPETPSTIAGLAAVPSLEERSWDVQATAAFFAVSTSTVRRLVRDGAIPYFRIGAQLRFNPDELRDWRAARSRRVFGTIHPLRASPPASTGRPGGTVPEPEG